jgi:Fe-S-cluster containining protein
MDDTGLRVALDQLLQDNERARHGIAELQQQIETLIEIMVAVGTLKPGHAELIAKLRRRVEVTRKAPVELSTIEDKYEVTGEPIDCESRLALCQARCCSFGVTLSRQDIAEGQLTWELEHPYRLARGPDGYCGHLGRDDARCQRYDHRPAICRNYSCKTDQRVWTDFEARIPAPMPIALIPLQRLTARRDG